MYALIYPMKNICFDLESTNLSGNPLLEMRLGIMNSNSFLSPKNPMWEYINEETWWIEQIGTVSVKQLNELPFFYFLYESDYINGEVNEKNVERETHYCSIGTEFITRSLFTGCWIVKDSCVCSQVYYLFDLKRKFISRVYTNHFPSLSSGLINMVSFNGDEIEESLKWMYIIASHDVWKKQTNELVPEGIDYESHFFSLERHISEKGSSYYRAFGKLERARMSGMVTEKIDKYCSVMECFFAINQSHKRNVSNIAAALMEKEGYDFYKVREMVRNAYSIRSDCSHGDEIEYLRKHSLEEMIDLSKTIDDYLRHIFRYMLIHPEYNYEEGLSKKVVRDHFENVVDPLV